MSKLGYTWYSQNWRASNTFRRLKKFPLVRYALRELFDLMYEEGAPIDMNREYLEDDFNIGLTDNDFNKLMEYIVVTDKGWWSDTVSIRLSKAEAARENGKKGGRPRKQNKTQKPRSETQEIIPKNPSLETKGKVKEKEKVEIESKIESKIEKEIENVFDVSEDLQEFPQAARAGKIYTLGNDIDTVVDNFNLVCGTEFRKGQEWIRTLIKTLFDNNYSISEIDKVVRVYKRLSQESDGRGGKKYKPENVTPNTLFNIEYFAKYHERAKTFDLTKKKAYAYSL